MTIMKLNPKYNFREGQISQPFFKSKDKEVNELIKRSVTFTLLSIPGVGVTQFLRHFVMIHNYYFTFIETLSLTSFSKSNFLKLILQELGKESNFSEDQDLFLACKARLEELIIKNDRVVIIFNRFNKFSKQLDYDFFSNLRLLRNINPEKIVMIFTANKPIDEMNPKAITGPNVNFLLHYLYFGTYPEPDLRKLIPVYAPHVEFRSKQEIDKAIDLSGGHINLLSLLLNCENADPLSDRYVNIQLKDIFSLLNYRQRNVLKKITLGKNISEVDDYLIKVGLVIKKGKDRFKVFTPLLEEYIKSHSYIRLPVKEQKLLSLLKKNLGKIVSKDEIFEALWGDNPDLGSDWALNALVYRLKKNSTFQNSGYVIENHKKMGYCLVAVE